MKVRGAEFIEWYDNHFPVGFYHDSDDDQPKSHDPDGTWLIDPAAMIDPDVYGYLAWGGKESGADTDVDPTDGDGLPISKAIARWRKTMTHVLVSALVPKDRLEEAHACLRGLGAIEVQVPGSKGTRK